MRIIGLILIAAIAALHVYIAYFEIFAWEERGPEIFTGFPPELFGQTVVLAINQGTYNSFLAVGLIWSLLITEQKWKWNVAICFLLFVAIAGIVGAATASPRILFVQTVPAALAIICVILARTRKS